MGSGVRKIYGPFKMEPFENSARNKCIRWHFNGIRDDDQIAHWALDYDRSTNRFNVTSFALRTGYIGQYRCDPVKTLPENRGMFLGGEIPRIMTGKISDILRKHLRPEDHAAIARFRITGEF